MGTGGLQGGGSASLVSLSSLCISAYVPVVMKAKSAAPTVVAPLSSLMEVTLKWNRFF